MRKIVFGFLWFVVFYFGICIAAGAVAGAAAGQAGSGDLQAASQAGEQVVKNHLPFIVGGAVTLSIAGTALGLLPGTRDRTPVT